MKKGFQIHVHYWQNSQIRELSPLQRGILSDIFSMLASETNRRWWGFLTDGGGKPLSERAIRNELGKPPLAAGTWQKARDEFMEREILKKVCLFRYDYIYCPPFVEMNPYDMSRKTNTLINQESERKPKMLKSELYIGYDPDDNRDDDELDTWGRVCRVWLELSGGKPPVRAELAMSSKVEIRDDIVRMVNEVGIENALHDMAVAFEFKARSGGRINSIEYLLMRWRSKDWIKRIDTSGGIQEKRKEYFQLKKTIQYYAGNGSVKSIKQLIEEYPNVDSGMLEKIGKEIGLK